MHLSRIRIENFRNFKLLDVELAGNIVVGGENRVGKTNLLYALRLIFDPTVNGGAKPGHAPEQKSATVAHA
ncbi:AAA family ATPase [Stappia indica]|uniref:AAA family ATPase n=1 Tax=Stappia indica TaxID=538381 RepID=UPI001CD425FF|nr:AAA family ATPase [Stappia indica]MCA1300586.1 AAA family ATPase [Stappia indica]